MAPKLLTKITAVLTLLMFVVVPAASAQDYTSTGGATFSSSAPGPGETLTISGKTTPDTTVTVTIESAAGSASLNRSGAAVLGKSTLGTTVSDSEGNYSLSVTIPSSATGDVVLSVMANGEMLGSSAYSVGGSAAGGGAGEQAAQTPTTDLPVTGSSSAWFLGVSAALLCAGGVLLLLARSNRSDA